MTKEWSSEGFLDLPCEEVIFLSEQLRSLSEASCIASTVYSCNKLQPFSAIVLKLTSMTNFRNTWFSQRDCCSSNDLASLAESFSVNKSERHCSSSRSVFSKTTSLQ